MDSEVRARDGVAFCTLGDTMLSLWQAPAEAERIRSAFAMLKQLAAVSPEGVIYFSLVLASSSPPDRATRARMQADFTALGGRLRRLVVVPLGNSVWQSVVRTLVRTIALVSGMAKKQSVSATVAEALDVVAVHAGPRTPSRSELESSIVGLCDALGLKRSALG